jgi:hypothetical protein
MVDLSVTRLDVVRRRVGKGPGEGLVLEHLLTARRPPVQLGGQREAPWGTQPPVARRWALTPEPSELGVRLELAIVRDHAPEALAE